MHKGFNNNEKGITLVEILAAIVILSILFVGVMTIFPQMTLMNGKTEKKLTTMNLASQEMATITAQEKWRKWILINPPDPLVNVPDFLSEAEMTAKMVSFGYIESTLPGPEGIKRFHRTADYLYEVDIYLHCEGFADSMLAGSWSPSTTSCDKTEKDKLYRVHVKLLAESMPASGNYQMISENFSYIIYKAVDETPLVTEGG